MKSFVKGLTTVILGIGFMVLFVLGAANAQAQEGVDWGYLQQPVPLGAPVTDKSRYQGAPQYEVRQPSPYPSQRVVQVQAQAVQEPQPVQYQPQQTQAPAEERLGVNVCERRKIIIDCLQVNLGSEAPRSPDISKLVVRCEKIGHYGALQPKSKIPANCALSDL